MTAGYTRIQRELRRVIGRLLREAELGQRDQVIEELLNLGGSLQEWGAAFALDQVIDALDGLVPDAPVEQRAWHLNLLGWRALQNGSLSQARADFEGMRSFGEESRNRRVTATALLNLGNVASLSGDLASALDLYTKSRQARPPQDAHGRVQCELNEASVLLDLGEAEKAERILNRITRRNVVRTNPHLLGSAEGIRGQIAIRRGDLESGEKHMLRAAQLSKQAIDLGHYLTALQNLGAVNLDLGRNGRALRWLRRARRLALRLEILRELDGIERTLATALYRSGRGTEAERLLVSARAAASARQDFLAVARLTADLGALLLIRQDTVRATTYLRKARSAFLFEAEWGWSVRTSLNLAEALARRGQGKAAAGVVDEVLDSAHYAEARRSEVLVMLGDTLIAHDAVAAASAYARAARVMATASPDVVADVLAESSTKLSERGHHHQVIALLTEALRERHRRSTVTTAQLLNDRGIAWARLGHLSEAEADLIDSLRASTRSRDRVMQALVAQNLSEVVRRLGKDGEAVEFGRKGLELARATNDQRQEADALGTLGLALAAAESLEEAVDVLDSSLRLASDLDLKGTQAIALGGLASVEYRREEFEAARDLYERAAAVERETHDVPHEAESMAALVQTNALLNDVPRAEAAAQRLVDLVQNENAPPDVALHGLEIAALMFLQAGHLEEAASMYAVGIVLSGESRGDADLINALGRAVIAPFIHGAKHGVDEERLAKQVAAALREQLRHLPRFLAEMLAMARRTARESIKAHRE
jgi:tetratricopeptide (TPR) repeat protein